MTTVEQCWRPHCGSVSAVTFIAAETLVRYFPNHAVIAFVATVEVVRGEEHPGPDRAAPPPPRGGSGPGC